MANDYADLIDRLGSAAMEARQTIRELHQARSDALQAKREIKQLLVTAWDDQVEGMVDDMVKTLTDGQNKVEASMLAKFDKMAQPLLEALQGYLEARDKIEEMLHDVAEQVRLAKSAVRAIR